MECNVSRETELIIGEDIHHPALTVYTKMGHVNCSSFPVNCDNRAYNFNKANFLESYNAFLLTNWRFLKIYTDNFSCEAFHGRL